MNEIKITIELSEADRARVDRLLALAESNQTVTRSTAEALVAWAHELDKAITRGVGQEAAEAAEEAQEAPTSPEELAQAETLARILDAPAVAMEPEKPAPAEEPAAPAPVDRKTVKRLAVKKIQEGKRDAVKAVIASFGVEKVDQVPEEKLAELETRLGEV